MTYSYKINLSMAAGILLLAMAGLPQLSQAQRFNHAGSGGGGRVSMPVHNEAPRPSQPVRSAPVVNRPAPAVQENRTINGGARNIGNHNFRPVNTVNTAPRAVVNTRDRVNVYHTGSYRGLHPYAYHPYHPYYWGPRWHPVGFFLAALTANAFRFAIGSQWYYYDDGCYYIPSAGGYSAVPPPIGAVVAYLPDGYETCMVGNDTFYYYAGAFYIAVQQGYQVVQAPVGAVVTELPVGAVDQQINGQDILVYNNVYYSPISQDGQDAYEVVQ
jgi:hypothetical protein